MIMAVTTVERDAAAPAKTAPAAQAPKGRGRLADSEKLTINLGAVDLGSIDLLVAEGFFSNRSDLIRTAVRNLLASHRDIVNGALARQERSLGLRRISRLELEALRKAGQRIRISVVGLVVVDDDVKPALAQETIESLSVLGSLQASLAVRKALAERLV
jgi:Arc/MetJ-type ribon-helix-helix transcriptional regulator